MDPVFVLCNIHPETIDHLLFECEPVKHAFYAILHWMGGTLQAARWA